MSYVGMILQTSSNSVYNYQLKQNTTCLLQEVAAFFGLLGFGNTFDWGNPLAYLQVEQMGCWWNHVDEWMLRLKWSSLLLAYPSMHISSRDFIWVLFLGSFRPIGPKENGIIVDAFVIFRAPYWFHTKNTTSRRFGASEFDKCVHEKPPRYQTQRWRGWCCDFFPMLITWIQRHPQVERLVELQGSRKPCGKTDWRSQLHQSSGFQKMQGFCLKPSVQFFKAKHAIFTKWNISENRGYPQIIHCNRVFHCKPSILGGYPYIWETPTYFQHWQPETLGCEWWPPQVCLPFTWQSLPCLRV